MTPISQGDYQSLFHTIDAGNRAQASIENRVREIIVHLRAFMRVNQATLDAATDGIYHRERLTGIFAYPYLSNRAGLYDVSLRGESATVVVTIEVSYSGESDYTYLHLPYAWLWASDAELTTIWQAELAALTERVAFAKRAQDAKEEAEARAQLEALRQRFDESHP